MDVQTWHVDRGEARKAAKARGLATYFEVTIRDRNQRVKSTEYFSGMFLPGWLRKKIVVGTASALERKI